MTTKEPIWVRDETALAIHGRQIAEHGGSEGVRDRGLLESARARPKNLFAYSSPKASTVISLPQLAASYAHGIAKNHPFVDGNKRTAFVVCELFLRLNDHSISATAEEKYLAFLSLAEGTLSEEKFAAWIQEHLRSRP